jgi:hypothetical protein
MPTVKNVETVVTAVACAYEVFALLANKPEHIPPISYLCWRWPVLGPVVVGSLTLHLVLGKERSSYRRWHPC